MPSPLTRLLAPDRLVVSAPLVSLIGVPVIMATRYIFIADQPDYVARRVPTISKTSALEVASYLFAPGMTIVALCALTAWWLSWRMNNARIAAAEPSSLRPGLCRWLNHCWLLGGVVVCLNLSLLAIVTLRVSNESHMAFSIVFFNTQVLAFIADAWCGALLSRAEEPSGRAWWRRLDDKTIFAMLIVLGSAFYFFMFLTKGLETFGDRMQRQWVYVFTEYILVTMFLSYPAFYYRKLKRHFTPPG